jgi:hypothetical protein
MTVIKMPEGEILRRSIGWVNEKREQKPGTPLITLIEEAGQQFDLSPKDCDFLLQFFTAPKNGNEQE